ncbi:MAG TPA: fimbrillin family protein [Bacteroides togonis]|nr:fimbrillin family protein [Bacteroides togonis]
MKLISAKTILGLSALLLFSCNNEDFLNQTEEGEPCNYICFGIAPDGGAQTKGGNQTNAKACTADRFVLRSADSADTLCVRTLISDGIQTAGNKAVTRGEPVTTEAFYDNFHVLTVKDQETSFFMNEDVTKIGNNWTMDNTYYWPGANHTLQFYAWAPADAITAPSSPENLTFEYTVPEEATAQQDLVVANESRDGDFKQAVSLGFKHICTAVKFVVGDEMQAGTIKSVALKGVKNTGTYDMTNGWTAVSGPADFTQTLDKVTTGSEGDGDEITSPAGTFMMLPQTLPSGASVEVVFHSATTNTDRTLSAPIEGTEWPIGKTVTYKLSITPEYELEFISESELQDAHYVIYPIHIKANDIPGNGEWTMTSTDSKVTLRTDLTILTNRGYWIEEDRGTQSISSTATGDDITVYAFLEENITDATREVVLELRPTYMPNATPATFTISQLCPSWNGNLGCERIEDGDEPWGFLWPTGMTITYNMQNAGLGDLIRNALLNAYLSWFTDYGQFITKETFLLSITSVTINYDAVPQVAVAKDENNGLKNTLELYNFNGINDVSTLEDILTNWGGTPDKELPLNPEEFAARSCSMKNKYHKTTEQQGNQTIEIPILPQDEITWYLPSKNEATQMTDETYPLSGDYWTSTNSLDEHDNENAFKYTAGGSTSLERRDVKLHVRAVRKKP